jgi:serine/threonine protein kinase
VKKVARAIIPCLEKLAELELVHLDLKLENLIVVNEEPLKLKLIDMAFTRPGIFKRNNASIQLDKICGTEGYISPEVILNKFHKNTDLWSYGVILWLIFSNEYPFASKATVYDLRYPRKGHQKSIQMMSENLKDFLLQIFTIIPEHRISLKQIKRHKFITRDVI